MPKETKMKFLGITITLRPVTPVDVVLAIDPKFADRADKAEERGQNELATANNQTTQANELISKAAGHRARGNRLTEAVRAFRDAVGG
ncbi:MAG: hypothetical protein UX13_C0007G0010 [Candidatus Woesebacteria bacterium GW2011_GWB1_45_5]|uniref:Uncharacterized protein n=1 Tax=Candidatus Woesebacteria bacterium GW2011_GWB1_45_5 TaxID=1618581 RepID=A0A0G1MQL0_9BACT|nr:MAG: hypothetical protein UX13_C0007G0010 [Candidatus Woesebacteria bacterium GW2011_GWB1_45_5]